MEKEMAGEDGKTRVRCSTTLIGYLLLTACRVQIQILLYFLKLSLPGPCLHPQYELETVVETLPRKRKRRSELTVLPSPEDRLESFMDKLSTWQLLGTLDAPSATESARDPLKSSLTNERDWMQAFCEDLVEPQCGNILS